MENQTHGELIVRLTSLQTKINKRLSGPLSVHGISLTEYLVLRQLCHTPGKKMRRIDLAETVGLSASGVTRLLNPMQKIGLVEKEESARDARVSLVALTRAGEQIFQHSSVSFNEAAQTLLAPLDSEQQATLFDIAGALVDR